MRADWIPCEKYKPNEPGAYLVTTAKGAVMIDRYDGESWARCVPRQGINGSSKGRYEPHKGWTFLPPPMRDMK